MPTLYIANPDGEGCYSWTFERVPWFEQALVRWFDDRNVASGLIWMGFLRGTLQVMEQIKLREAALQPQYPHDGDPEE